MTAVWDEAERRGLQSASHRAVSDGLGRLGVGRPSPATALVVCSELVYGPERINDAHHEALRTIVRSLGDSAAARLWKRLRSVPLEVWRLREGGKGSPLVGPESGDWVRIDGVLSLLGGAVDVFTCRVVAFEGFRFATQVVPLAETSLERFERNFEAGPPGEDRDSFWQRNRAHLLDAIALPDRDDAAALEPEPKKGEDTGDEAPDEAPPDPRPYLGFLRAMLSNLAADSQLGPLAIAVAAAHEAEDRDPIVGLLMTLRARLMRMNPWWEMYGLAGSDEGTVVAMLELLGARGDWTVLGEDADLGAARCHRLDLPEEVLAAAGFDRTSPVVRLAEWAEAQEDAVDPAISDALSAYRTHRRWVAMLTQRTLAVSGRLYVMQHAIRVGFLPLVAERTITDAVPDKRTASTLLRVLRDHQIDAATVADLPLVSDLAVMKGIGPSSIQRIAEGLEGLIVRLERERLAEGEVAQSSSADVDNLSAGLDTLESLFT